MTSAQYIIAKLRERGDPVCDLAAREIERLLRELDETRRAWQQESKAKATLTPEWEHLTVWVKPPKAH